MARLLLLEDYMLSITLRRAEHERHYSIQLIRHAGWEVRLEEDRTVKHHIRYDDWHRVERAVELFRREVEDLTAQGWVVQAASPILQAANR